MPEQKEQNTTTVIHENTGGSGWFIAIILLILIVIGGWYVYRHFQGTQNDTSDINVQVQVPDNVMPGNQQ